MNNAYLTKPVTLKGNNIFNGNGGTGLQITSYGAITTSSITAVGNINGNGALLDNCNANAGSCDTPTVKSIVMNGNNYFEKNGNLGSSTGLLISSRGAVTITNLTSIDNGYDGVNINNAESNAFGAVTIKGFAFVSNNDENGMQIIANGTVTLMNVTANGNGNHGADINNDISFINPVILNGNNLFNDNLLGLAIDSWGAIKVNNVLANDNPNGGIILLNYSSPNNQPITITGYGTFNNNINGGGLYVWSAGHVTLANITANYNLHTGAFIQADNTNSDTKVSNLTITGFGTFNGNNQEGLRVFTDGAITLSNITANNNYFTGAMLNNSSNYVSGPVQNVTLNGINSFNQNRLGGLEIHATGNVTLTRVTANDHTDLVAGAPRSFGVSVNSTGGNITFTCGSMYYNEGSGYILSAGTGKVITLKGVTTFGNDLGNTLNVIPVITRACPLP